jgi:hypothetical protein
MKYQDIPTKGAYVVLVRSYGALARIIQFGMWLWQFFRLKEYPRKTYNHADIVVNGFVVGAIGRGVDVRSIEEAYGDGKKRELKVYLLSPKPEDVEVVREYLQEQIGKPYEWKNFWHHAVRILKGNWSGKTGDEADSEFYCIELAAGAVETLYSDNISKEWQINPVEFERLCHQYLTQL